MKSRLKKNNNNNNNNVLMKKASNLHTLHSFILNSGDIISFIVKIISNKPWYQINHSHQYHNSSYYDGLSFDEANKFYEELLLAFKKLDIAEYVRKNKNNYIEQINKIINFHNNSNIKPLRKKTLFLGINDF